MNKSIFFLYIFVILLLLEFTVFQNAYFDCKRQNTADLELVNRDVCINPEDRILFTDTVDCEGAEKRLRMNVPVCTVYTWASKSNPSQLFKRLTDSYWSIIGIFLPLCLMYMYLWSQRKSEMALAEKFDKMARRNNRIRNNNNKYIQ